MIMPESITVEGRRELMDKALHENLLEGITPSPKMNELLNKCVAGTITIDEVIERLIKGSTKVA